MNIFIVHICSYIILIIAKFYNNNHNKNRKSTTIPIHKYSINTKVISIFRLNLNSYSYFLLIFVVIRI
jgi:hypothetical protein